MATLTDYIRTRNTAAAPTAPAPITSYDTDADAPIRQAWGLSVGEWQGMTDSQHVNYRWNVAKAPNFNAEGK